MPTGREPDTIRGTRPCLWLSWSLFHPPITTSCSWEDPTALVLSRRHLRQINTSACEHMACLWKGTQDSTLGGVETQSCTLLLLYTSRTLGITYPNKMKDTLKKKKVIADINDVTCALRWVGCCYLGRMAFFFLIPRWGFSE